MQVKRFFRRQMAPPRLLKKILDAGPNIFEYFAGFDVQIDQFLPLFSRYSSFSGGSGKWVLSFSVGFNPVVAMAQGAAHLIEEQVWLLIASWFFWS